MKITFLFRSLLALWSATRTISAFGPFQTAIKSASKANNLSTMTEAIGLYQKAYPAPKTPRKRAWNAAVGMPARDVDGKRFRVAQTDEMGTAFSDVNESQLQATYTVLCKYFGEASALQMVKDVPLVLAVNRQNVVPNMSAFSETFGTENAKAMVERNPSLLFLKPSTAATADNLTMQFSYVVAWTRPAGPFLLTTLLLLLCEPGFETFTGIKVKESLVAAIWNSS